MELLLVRDDCGANSTLGKLSVDGVYQCETLEDTDRKLEDGGVKIPGDTAIPRGTYEVVLDWSPHFNRTLPQVMNVPGYSGIRIHPGNAPKDTEGCILVGLRRGPDYVYQSVVAFDALYAKLEAAFNNNEDINITVQ